TSNLYDTQASNLTRLANIIHEGVWEMPYLKRIFESGESNLDLSAGEQLLLRFDSGIYQSKAWYITIPSEYISVNDLWTAEGVVLVKARIEKLCVVGEYKN